MLLSSVIWAVVGIILIGAEMLLPGFIIIFFGLGALLTAVLALLPPIAAAPGLQAILFAASSLISLAFLRRHFSKALKGTIFDPDKDGIEELSGETAEVVEAIRPEAPGRARWRGTTWKAVSYTETIDPGARVIILGKEGMTLVVSSVGLEKMKTEEP